MREELQKLYQDYMREIDKEQAWTRESFMGFIEWLITGEIK